MPEPDVGDKSVKQRS